MRKIISAVIIFAVCISMCACGQTAEDQTRYKEMSAALEEAAGIKCNVEVKKGGFLSATVNIPATDDLSYFGRRAYNIIIKASDLFADEGDYTLRINKETSDKKYQGKDYIYVTASNSGKYFCRYYDNREETPFYKSQEDCNTPDDLAKYFPDLQIRLKEARNLTPDELLIWDVVWAKLDAEPNRDEQDIYNEIAPSFNMTGEELNSFIRSCMEKVYG